MAFRTAERIPQDGPSVSDAWRLFLRFAAARRRKQVANLQLEDLTAMEVLAFLRHVENERKAPVRTRNCRLAAIRSFFSFVADREPLAAKLCNEVLRVPFKKAPKRALCYLESGEVAALLSQPDRTSIEGQCDHVLLSFLYNTGARIQEALSLRPGDLHLKSPAQVKLMGKGQKERISPIWPETAELISGLLRRNPRQPDETILGRGKDPGLIVTPNPRSSYEIKHLTDDESRAESPLRASAGRWIPLALSMAYGKSLKAK